MICTRLRLSHLSVRAGDSTRRSEEVVKISNYAFPCDYADVVVGNDHDGVIIIIINIIISIIILLFLLMLLI